MPEPRPDAADAAGGPRSRRRVRGVRPPELRLRPPAVETSEPVALTEGQRRVVEHAAGPLLVLGGPGTGKTTAIVEAVAARVAAGARPEEILVLTFSRRAAVRLRRRISARLGRATAGALAFTVHGFCLAVLRRFGAAEVYGPDLRLLSGPEQELRLRETLEGTDPDSWPEAVRAAWQTRGFAAEVRALLARTRQWGMDPADLVTVGEHADSPAWVRLGGFFDEYLDVLDAEQVLDYAELVHRCRILLSDPEHRDQLHREISAVYVDEFGDTDPAQVELITQLAGPQVPVVLTGDPDQSIFGFRGAQARSILDAPQRFAVGGRPAPTVTLREGVRLGPALTEATRRIAARLPLPTIPAGATLAAVSQLRDLQPADRPDRVQAYTFVSPGAEADHVATVLRRAHLDDGLDYADMAVLVRSGRRCIPPLVRSLTAAGVPVEVAGDEIPLAAELAVRPLLLAIQIASGERLLDADAAVRLLISPLGGLDALGVRRLRRRLREAERIELAGAGLPRPSAELLREALLDPEWLDDLLHPGGEVARTGGEVARARALAGLIASARALIDQQATASEVLWHLWSATGWPDRLRAAAFAGGAGGRRADRDLDAVNALFALAARSEELVGHRGVTSFLAEVEAQQIPGDTLDEAPIRGGRVRVLTAHRAKGLQWPLVVVASVQEGLWPDLRSRDTLLGADRLSPDGVGAPEPVAARIAEERRLFYVACSRATTRLLVTAVAGTDGEADQPSRFLTELGVPVVPVVGRGRRPVTLAALVAELRRHSVDPDVTPALRRAAADRLARLADARDDTGRSLVPAADPSAWWGLREPTRAPDPPTPVPISMSGSQLGSVLACPRQWFLSRRARAERGRGTAASFGSCLHVLIDHATRTGTDPYEMIDHLDQVWEQLDFDAVWLSGVERVQAELAVERFATWQSRRGEHEVIGTEVRFAGELELTDPAGEPTTIALNGTIDRLERDPMGRIHVIDFKTGRTAPTQATVTLSEQLGFYQLAVAIGAVEGIPAGTELAGASLVYLRHDQPRDPGMARTLHQPSLSEQPWPEGTDPDEAATGPTWVHDRLLTAVRTIRSEAWQAIRNPGCRWCQFATSCPAQSQGGQVVA